MATYFYKDKWFQDLLLHGGPSTTQTGVSRVQQVRAERCRVVLICGTFALLGVCLALIGPTLPELEVLLQGAYFRSTVGFISICSFGNIVGLISASFCVHLVNPLFILPWAAFGCGISSICIPFSHTFATSNSLFFLQGICLGLLERTCLWLFIVYWRRKVSFLYILYVAFAIGALLTALISAQFVYTSKTNSSTSSSVDTLSTTVTNSIVLQRSGRKAPDTISANQTTTAQLTATATSTLSSTNSTQFTTFSTDSSSISIKTLTTTISDVTTQLPNSTAVDTTTSLSKTTLPITQPTASSKTTVVEAKSTSTASTVDRSSTSMPPLTFRTSTSNATNVMFVDSWEQMYYNAALLNNQTHISYIFGALFCLMMAIFYLCACCVLPCGSLKPVRPPPPSDADDALQLHDNVLLRRYQRYSHLLTFALSFSLSGVHSTAYNLLTVFAIVSFKQDQQHGILLTAGYWLANVLALLCLIVIGSNTFLPSRLLTFSLPGAAVVCGILAVFVRYSVPLLWIGVVLLGILMGTTIPVSLAWADQYTGILGSVWPLTVALTGLQMGRMLAPILTACSMKAHSGNDFLFSLLVQAVMAIFFYIVGLRIGKRISQLQQANAACAVERFAFDIKKGSSSAVGINGDLNNQSSSFSRNGMLLRGPQSNIIELENVDELLFDDTTVHFDRSRDLNQQRPKSTTSQPADDSGVFDQYFISR